MGTEHNGTYLLGIIGFKETGEEIETVGEFISFKEAAAAGNRLIKQLKDNQGITIRPKGNQ